MSKQSNSSSRTVLEWSAAGFTSELLPILPVDAEISTTHSRNPAQVRQGRGKIPGKKCSDGWVGLTKFTAHVATLVDCKRWSEWDCGTGMLGRHHPGLDVDVMHPELADLIEREAFQTLGIAPVRYGRGSRRLLVYRGRGFKKRRLAFRMPDAAADEVHAVELLGDGQQYVVEGIHPKTRQPYYWRGPHPVELGPAGLTELSHDAVEEFFENIRFLVTMVWGGELTKSLNSAGGERSRAPSQQQLVAPSLDAVQRALAAIPNDVDRDTWLKVGAAVKAATSGSEDGYAAFEDWSLDWPENTPEGVRALWESLRPPFHVGWPWLARLADEHGFCSAAEDFPALPEPAQAQLDDARPALQGRTKLSMIERCVWVEKLERICDTARLKLMTRTQFNAAFASIGSIASAKDCAWTAFLDSPERQTVQSVTYRPGGELFVFEPAEGGECVNVWKPGTELIPGKVADADVRRWLDHLAYLFPDELERETLINWLAWVVQNQGLKPNWGVLIGSPRQGNGKSILLEPLRVALGRHNVRNVSNDDLASGYSDWLIETKVFVVEEIHTYERKSTMNRLKNYLATPPDRLRINEKYGKQFEIPNLVAGVFFTNHNDAIALERSDRRFYILWTEVAPRPDSYYVELVSWLEAGGAAACARWLLDRDLGAFSAMGRAPDTAAKREMQRASQSGWQQYLEHNIETQDGPFHSPIVCLEDVRLSIPDDVCGKHGRPASRALSSWLRARGLEVLTRLGLGIAPPAAEPLRRSMKEHTLLSVRDHETHSAMGPGELRRAFWDGRTRPRPSGAETEALLRRVA